MFHILMGYFYVIMNHNFLYVNVHCNSIKNEINLSKFHNRSNNCSKFGMQIMTP